MKHVWTLYEINKVKPQYQKTYSLEEENETPQIKETHPEVKGTSAESPVPQVSSIPMVNSTSPTSTIYIPSHPVSQNQSISLNTGRILGSPGLLQLGPLEFILIGAVRPVIAKNMGGSID